VNAYIQALGTALPAYRYDQLDSADVLGSLLGGKRTTRIFRELARHSAIDTRYSVLPDFAPNSPEPLLFSKNMSPPSTATRNLIYEQLAPPLAAKAGKQALTEAVCPPKNVTHLITVSCTGFFAPGLDVNLIRDLELNPNVQRFHLGFMGCYAALPALHLASQIVSAQPKSNVLVVCCELCSLHYQPTDNRDNLLSASIFADGAGAALVNSEPTGPVRLGNLGSALIPDSTDAMSWRIGDTGFIMGLAREVPHLIATGLQAHLASANDPMLADLSSLNWAVHPGGISIIEACATGLNLPSERFAVSRDVLRSYGNLSSATILFVLKEKLARKESGPGCALAFGPGLTANWLGFHL
jgi:predicted naringenin-chalcone synthase